jgi:hypothetical protein
LVISRRSVRRLTRMDFTALILNPCHLAAMTITTKNTDGCQQKRRLSSGKRTGTLSPQPAQNAELGTTGDTKANKQVSARSMIWRLLVALGRRYGLLPPLYRNYPKSNPYNLSSFLTFLQNNVIGFAQSRIDVLECR